ncbi:RNA polymerase sigma factor [Paraglaciecola sp. 2405UD69-4]|uniref:RNA polymerase sigma factor n=1 Tax=Paraglaciecola sp. 2405UD69-4 TaxID=3391836 RepID=UPI0039C9E63C
MDQKLSQSESIILRISRGDKDAEQELVATYYRGLMFILNRQTQNQSLSEDLAQDTFMIVIQKARNDSITNPAALAAFIRQTGINLLIGHKRKESRRDTHSVDNVEIHAPTDNMEISQALHSNKLLEITTQLLNELKSPRDKEILQNYFVYEQNKQQICEDLALTKEHFDRVLFRARQRLKQLIQHKLGSEDKSSKITATYLSLGIFVAAFNLQSSELKREYLFAIQVRDKQHQEHLPITTPKMNSRYIPQLTSLGMPLTSKSRCA